MIYFTLLITIILTSISLSLLSPVLVLKKESMIVDAISHSVLPGIVFSYLIVGTLNSWVFDFFSVVFTFIVALAIDFIFHKLKTSRESLIGMIYSFMFALGVVLVNYFARDVHLDADAVLFGQIEYTLFDNINLFGLEVFTIAQFKIFILIILQLIWLAFFSRSVLFGAFDQNFIKISQYRYRFYEYLYYLLLSIILIQSFKIVGVILVLSLAVVPAMIAKLFTNKLKILFYLSVLFGFINSIISFLISVSLDLSLAGTVSFVNLLVLMFVYFLKNKSLQRQHC